MKCRRAECCSGALRDCLSHYIQWSIKWISVRDKMIPQLVWMWMDLNISSVFHQRYFLCPRKQQRGSSFNLSGVPSNPCLTFKSPSNSREHRADHYVQLCSSRQSEMQPESHSRGKKTTECMSESIWLLSLEIYSIVETKCRTKWQKMVFFSATLMPSRGWKDSHKLSSAGEHMLLRIIVNQPYSPALFYCSVTGREKWGGKAAGVSVENRWSDLKCLFLIVGMTHKSQKHYIINEPC